MMKPNRNLWEWTTFKFNFIYELYTVLGNRKKKISNQTFGLLKKKGGGVMILFTTETLSLHKY